MCVKKIDCTQEKFVGVCSRCWEAREFLSQRINKARLEYHTHCIGVLHTTPPVAILCHHRQPTNVNGKAIVLGRGLLTPRHPLDHFPRCCILDVIDERAGRAPRYLEPYALCAPANPKSVPTRTTSHHGCPPSDATGQSACVDITDSTDSTIHNKLQCWPPTGPFRWFKRFIVEDSPGRSFGYLVVHLEQYRFGRRFLQNLDGGRYLIGTPGLTTQWP